MRFTARGHPAVRATHPKTLELIVGDALTERGTCVLAVGAEAEPPVALAGPVRIRVSAGTHRFTLDALANPMWEPGGPIVIRRGPLRLPGTFATDATAASSDLPRDLVAALQDPDALVTVDVVAVPAAQPVVVLFTADPDAATPNAALRAELDRADEVIAEDAAARRLAGATRGEPGGRTLVVATADLPGRTCVDRLSSGGLDTVGLSPLAAVAAACPSRALLTCAASADDLARVPSTHRLVFSVRRLDLPDLLQRAADRRGSGVATVQQEHGRPLPAAPGDVPDLAGADVVACCLRPAPEAEAITPDVRAALDALVADGVATKTAAKALAALTGWERRRAYDAVLAWPAS